MIQALLISALGFAFAVGTDRGDDMIATMLRRGCQAIRDLDTVTLVRETAGSDICQISFDDRQTRCYVSPAHAGRDACDRTSELQSPPRTASSAPASVA